MTLRNDELAERFARGGKSSGSAARMELKTTNRVRYVVGYGWAVYAAARPPDYYLFGDGYKSDGSNRGWSGYSSTTTKHIQVLKEALERYTPRTTVVDFRLEESDLLDAATAAQETTRLAELKRAHGTEPLDYTGHLYRKDE